MRLFFAFRILAFLVVSLVLGNEIVCQTLDESKTTQQCQGQTIFIHGPKGDKGAPANESRLEQLEGQIEILKNNVRQLQKEFSEHIGWYTLNGYEYKLTQLVQNWNDSRDECKLLGGDLAVFGVQDNAARRWIASAVAGQLPHETVWIGLHDMDKDGAWQWINTTVANENAHWRNNSVWNCDKPNNNSGCEYCGEMYLGRGYSFNDNMCNNSMPGLCERRSSLPTSLTHPVGGGL